MTAEYTSNNFHVTLAGNGGSITSNQTTINVSSVTGMPALPFRAAIGPANGDPTEIMLVTGNVSTTLTVSRGIEAIPGTGAGSGVTHNDGDAFAAVLTQAGLGNILAGSPFAVIDQGGAVYNVKAYGAKGDGTTDDTVAINAAISALPAAGGTIVFPPGVYPVSNVSPSSTCINLWQAGTKLIGYGARIKLTSTSDYMMTIGNADISIQGITIDTNGQTSAVGVYVGAQPRTVIRDCIIPHGLLAGVNIVGAATDLLIEGNRFSGGSGYAILTDAASTVARLSIIGNKFLGSSTADGIEINTPSGGATDVVISGNTVTGYTATGSAGIGIGLAHVLRGVISGNTVDNCGLDGIHVEDGSQDIAITGNVVYNCQRSGITINSGNAARFTRNITVSGNTVDDCVQTTGTGGIALEGAEPAQNITITGNSVKLTGPGASSAAAYGIDVIATGSANVVVNGNVVQDTLGTANAGIRILASSDCVIANNRSFDSGPATQLYGLLVTGVQARLRVQGNSLAGNVTAAISDTSSGTVVYVNNGQASDQQAMLAGPTFTGTVTTNDLIAGDGLALGNSGPNRSIGYAWISTDGFNVVFDGVLAGGNITFRPTGNNVSGQMQLAASGNLTVAAALIVGQSATAPATASSGTIATANLGVSRVSPSGAVSAVILAAGSVAGQTVTVVNEAIAANTITFAVAGTSHVADGASTIIPGLASSAFVWDSTTALWYRAR